LADQLGQEGIQMEQSEVETTFSNEEQVMEALRVVIDPEIGLNVVELGLIREVTIEDSHTKVTMILTTPFCPYGPAMVEQVRSTADQVNEGTTEVEVGTELWDPSMMEEGAGGDWGLF
jgi:metal-sulfur cluster biosynthetic enzyme